MNKKRILKETILMALESSAHRWRTAKGLSNDTGIPLKDVSKFLDESPDIIRSKKAGSQGKPLFATRAKNSETNSALKSGDQYLTNENESDGKGGLKYLALLPLDASVHRLRDTIGCVIRGENSQPVFLSELLPGAGWVDQVVDLIRSCDVVIGDVTRMNPNRGDRGFGIMLCTT